MGWDEGIELYQAQQAMEASAKRVLELASGAPQDQLKDALIRQRHIGDLGELAFSRMASRWAETDEYEEEGAVSPTEWIRHNCKMGSGTAVDRVNVGQRLADLPESGRAVESGEIGFAHLSLIARTATAVAGAECPERFDERLLLERARESSVGRLWHFCQHIRHATDPEGVAAEQREAIERRWFRLSPCEDGSLSLDGWLDPAGGATLRTTLGRLSQLSGPEDDRAFERRQGDALVELCAHGLDAGVLPQRAGHRPHLQVTASLDTLRGLAGSPAGEMEFTLPVSAETVRRLACDSTITRVVLGSESAVIDVGRAKRVVPGSTRRALDVRDKQCQWPGCDRPPSWAAAHHLVHWAKGGDTDLDNLLLLCHRHHTMVHEGGWQLVRTDEGGLLTIPPGPGLFGRARAPDEFDAA